MGPKKHSLRKEERLKSRKKIDRLFSHGQSFSVYPYKIYFLLGSDTSTTHHPFASSPQMGVGASKKHFKTAVKRNRIKRITREAYRIQKEELTNLLRMQHKSLDVFLIYIGNTIEDFTAIMESIKKILFKLQVWVHEHP